MMVDLRPGSTTLSGTSRFRGWLRAAILSITAQLILSYSPCALAAPPENDPAVPAILAAAESLFQAMRDRDYDGIFASLSAKSRETIVTDTIRPIPPTGGKAPTMEEVARDFEAGGPIAKEYWTAYLLRFDPNDALERSRWEMGKVEKDRAEVLITRQGSDRPAVLRMFREEGGWKAGLVETFW